MIEFILKQLTLSNFVLFIFFTILFLVLHALYDHNKNKKEIWQWKQLISEPNGTASQTKVMQLIGSITGTFVVIYQTVQNSLMSEVFIAYLAALGLSAGFSRWLKRQDSYNHSSYNQNIPDVSEDEIEQFKHNNQKDYF